MKKKILAFVCAAAGLSIVLTAVLIHMAVYQDIFDDLKQTTAAAAEYLAALYESNGNGYLESPPGTDLLSPGDGLRVTLIAPGGQVLYDTAADGGALPNHLGRPEVQEARDTGAGDSLRLSETISRQTYYYAVRLRNGGVLRTASAADSIFIRMINLILISLGIAVVVFMIILAAGSRMTEQIVSPINRIDLDHPEDGAAYDELAPLLMRIKQQNDAIAGQLEEMRKRRNEFTTIINNMREGLLVLDQDGRILSCNKSAGSLLGIRMERVEYQLALAVRRDEPFRGALEKALHGTPGETELSVGQRRLRLFASPVAYRNVVQGVILLILDITERTDRDRLRREFSANVSHELKTPLTIISGFAEIMAGGMVKQEDAPRFAEKIYGEAQRLIHLVDDVMALSRLDEDAALRPKEEADLLSLARSAAGRLAGAAARRKLTLMVDGDEARIPGVPHVLDEMLFNLLDNAVKYNREGGEVRVVVEKRPEECTVTVEDTGPGIPADEQDRIFERFYRADKSRSAAVEGTGLGLSIVKHGAALHHAKVEVYSDGKAGARFTLRFPGGGNKRG
ncbi:MAG: PAS domain-containing protein [Spirochaetaceae bacterium]|jgi:two-component system phosphate regulon sensor histidine kinase PhoR|nr:PAS domain-containing protein [Spirochaetaceae bacterium]